MCDVLVFFRGNPLSGWAQDIVVNFKKTFEKETNKKVKIIYFNDGKVINDKDFYFIKINPKFEKHIYINKNNKILNILEKEKPKVIILHNFNISLLRIIKKYKEKNNCFFICIYHDYFSCCLASGNSNYYQKVGKVPPVCDNMKISLECIKCLKNKILFPYKYIIHKIKNNYLDIIDLNVSPSKHLSENMKKHGYKNVVSIHNGIDLNNWRYFGYEKYDPNMFLFVGSIGENKGIYNLLYAFEKFHRKYPDAKLYYVGGGETEKLKKKVNRLNLSKNVKVIGRVDRKKLVDFYSRCRCLVVPSVWMENFPTVILEALSIGKTVIGSNFGGPKEIIEESKGGFVFNPFDIDEFSYALEKAYLLDKKTLIDYGKNGRKWVEENCSIEKYVENFIEIFKKYEFV